MSEAEKIPFIILFDGLCNFCCSSVNFIISHDPAKKFRFASLQSEFGKSLLLKKKFPEKSDSLVLVKNDTFYIKSSAALEIALHLDKIYPLIYFFIIIPPFIRNHLYDFFAKNRYRWFGKKENCMIPGEEIKERFIDL